MLSEHAFYHVRNLGIYNQVYIFCESRAGDGYTTILALNDPLQESLAEFRQIQNFESFYVFMDPQEYTIITETLNGT
jgi:hypothetical protein